MIRVVHVITDMNIGGAGRLLLNLLNNRNRSQFDMTVILPRGSMLLPEVEATGCRIVEAEAIADRSLSLAGIAELARLLRAERPDILHAHAAMSARIAARLFTRCRIVSTRHSYFEIPAYRKRFPYKTITGFINNFFSDWFIAVSPPAMENLTDIGVKPAKITMVMNGADPAVRLNAEERASIRRRYGLSDTDFVCAILARLEKYKGQEHVIAAARQLPPDVKIVFAGSGSEERNLKDAARGLDQCLFTGFVRDIHEIENITDVQLNASCGCEAASLSLIEGMSLGVPAIVSTAGGNPFVIEDGVNGLVIPQGDPDAIARAILELKKSPERYKEMSENAAKIFAKRFTALSMTEAVEREYSRLMQ